MYQRRNFRVFQSLKEVQQYNLSILWHQMGQGLTEFFVVNGNIHPLHTENLTWLFRLARSFVLRGQRIMNDEKIIEMFFERSEQAIREL